MSYDINFWKQERSLPLSAEQIYGRLCKREAVDGLARLPVDSILARLRERFPGFDPKADFPDVDVDGGNIEFIWSDQHFRFDLRGDVPAADRNALVQIMRDFGCPLYDPQVNQRYDADSGASPADAPAFEDATPEQKAQMEKIKTDLLAKFANQQQKQKKGCAAPAAIFLLLAGATTWIIGRLIG